jgi:putative Holliday junction resolvase
MRVAAVDLESEVGLASRTISVLAHPRRALLGSRRSARRLAWSPGSSTSTVSGRLPLNRRGEEGNEAVRARRFAQALADVTGCEVELVDERLSTVEATRRLSEVGVSAKRRRPLIDSASAAVLLQAWLEGRREPSG